MAVTEWGVHRMAVGQKQIQILLCDDDTAFLTELYNEMPRLFTYEHIRVAWGSKG